MMVSVVLIIYCNIIYYAKLYYVTLYYVILRYVMFGHFTSRGVTLQVMSKSAIAANFLRFFAFRP